MTNLAVLPALLDRLDGWMDNIPWSTRATGVRVSSGPATYRNGGKSNGTDVVVGPIAICSIIYAGNERLVARLMYSFGTPTTSCPPFALCAVCATIFATIVSRTYRDGKPRSVGFPSPVCLFRSCEKTFRLGGGRKPIIGRIKTYDCQRVRVNIAPVSVIAMSLTNL